MNRPGSCDYNASAHEEAIRAIGKIRVIRDPQGLTVMRVGWEPRVS